MKKKILGKYLVSKKWKRNFFYNLIHIRIWDKVIEVELPCPSFSIAAVIKILNTFLKTLALKIKLGDPEPFQATIIIAWTEVET